MSESTANGASQIDLSVTAPAQAKMAELVGQAEDGVNGIRVYAAPGGCSGITFGMAFTDQVNDNDAALQCEGFQVVVDDATMQYLRGVEIDYVEQEAGQASFVFNNLQPMPGAGGCSSCGSDQGGGCS